MDHFLDKRNQKDSTQNKTEMERQLEERSGGEGLAEWQKPSLKEWN